MRTRTKKNKFIVSANCDIDDEQFEITGDGRTLLEAIKYFDESFVNFTNMTEDEYNNALNKYKNRIE